MLGNWDSRKKWQAVEERSSLLLKIKDMFKRFLKSYDENIDTGSHKERLFASVDMHLASWNAFRWTLNYPLKGVFHILVHFQLFQVLYAHLCTCTTSLTHDDNDDDDILIHHHRNFVYVMHFSCLLTNYPLLFLQR